MDAIAIAYLHTHLGYPRPNVPEISEFLKGLKQRHTPQRADALSPAEVAAICDLLDREPNQPLAARNRALLLLDVHGAFRRQALCGLEIPTLTFVLQGIEVFLRRDKTDQRGEGRRVPIWRQRDPSLCPVRAVQHWLRILQRDRGPLFPAQLPGGAWSWRAISPDTFYAWFKDVTALLEGHYSPHSLRATNITWQIDAGATDDQIKRTTGIKSSRTIRTYDRFTDPWATPNFAQVLLCE